MADQRLVDCVALAGHIVGCRLRAGKRLFRHARKRVEIERLKQRRREIASHGGLTAVTDADVKF